VVDPLTSIFKRDTVGFNHLISIEQAQFSLGFEYLDSRFGKISIDEGDIPPEERK
jgi:hypothetical protein